MAGLSIPDDFPLQALVGQEVTQVCLGVSQVQIHFYAPMVDSKPQRWEPGAQICIEAGYEFGLHSRDKCVVQNNQLASKGGQLGVLLGDTVVSVERLERNELLVRFASDAFLQLLTGQDGFESYHLYIAGESIDITKQ
jgi:hypothetical protein